MEVHDNFLPAEEFQNLSNCILSPEFDWHYLSGICSHDNPPGSFQFIHMFYDPDTGSQSPYLPVLNYTLEKLGVQSLRRIKSNLTPKSPEPFEGGFHIEFYTLFHISDVSPILAIFITLCFTAHVVSRF